MGSIITCDLYRPGIANGASGVGKSDGVAQQAGLGIRSSMSRTDLDGNSLVNDRRDNSIGSDKERVNLRGVNKYIPSFLTTNTQIFLFLKVQSHLLNGPLNLFAALLPLSCAFSFLLILGS